ncbi:FkbM family methyltransferase [Candidatus Woesearchaeota archaeon]|nr:FkbM family methyltransferase [Candidatus Woesearchaeota archaeon]
MTRLNLLSKIKTTFGIITTFRDWPKFMLYYFEILKPRGKNTETTFTFWNGLKWHVDASKRGFAVISDVWIKHPYWLLFKIKNPKIIFDFGAHIGSFSIMAAKKYPEAKIYAFEASKENYVMLKKNLRENKIKNVHAYNVGVGAKNCILDFFINEKNTVMNSFVRKGKGGSYKVKCKNVSKIFDELRIKKCDFMKIDVEGFEYRVLKGAERDGSLEKINAVATEVAVKMGYFKKTEELLRRNGFKVNTVVDIISAVRK